MKILSSLLLVCAVALSGQTIKMTTKQASDLGVRTQEVTKIDSITYGPYNGVVVLNKKDIISIGANLESVVKNIYVRKFQEVKKGEKLLSFESNALLNLQKEYIEALIESKNINETYERNLKLKEEGIIASKKLALSKKEKSNADLQIKLSKNYLLASGLDAAMLKKIENSHMPITQITITAQQSGIIYEIHVNVGEMVSSNKSMMTLYGDGERSIELTVPVKVIENISIGDICTFGDFTSKVTNIGRVVSSASQSVEVRALIEDSKNIIINRIYDVKIEQKIQDAVKIKKSALVYEGTNTLVFKKLSDGYEVIAVDVISEGPTCYIVRGALNVGDNVAVTSTSALLSGMGSNDE